MPQPADKPKPAQAKAAADKPPAHPLYVSSVEGHLVTRYGSPDGSYIGAERRAGGGVAWDTEAIVPIPQGELDAHRREYRGHIARGELRERKPEEHAELAARAKAKQRESADSARRELAAELKAELKTDDLAKVPDARVIAAADAVRARRASKEGDS